MAEKRTAEAAMTSMPRVVLDFMEENAPLCPLRACHVMTTGTPHVDLSRPHDA